MTAYELERTYLFLDGSGAVERAPGGPRFWANIHNLAVAGDTMVIVSEGAGDWPRWEMHPKGDEILVILEGSPRFFLEHADGALESIATGPGSTLVIPKGAWHRAEGPPGDKILFITYGPGTTHREVTEQDRARGREAALSA
jgi:mannose-6-phosphate isomerase-like protein (cupin superfamily)